MTWFKMSADRKRHSCFLFLELLHIKIIYKLHTFPPEIYLDVISNLTLRGFVITDLCELGCREKLSTELKAAINTTCAAVCLVAALLLSAYFLNDWPAHMLNEHKVFSSYIWRPVRPTPFAVRQVCYIGGKIFITFIKLKEVVLGEGVFLCAWNNSTPQGMRSPSSVWVTGMWELFLNRPSLMLVIFKAFCVCR